MTGLDSERRRYPREQRVGVVDYAGGTGVGCSGIVNIAIGGIRLMLTAIEKPGTRVRLRIALEQQGQPIDVTGQVVWARTAPPYEAGVRFLEVDASRLRDLL